MVAGSQKPGDRSKKLNVISVVRSPKSEVQYNVSLPASVFRLPASDM
jgi:hypothetical protein